MSRGQKKKESHRDPVCGKRVNRNKAHIAIEYKGREFRPVCQAEFERDPEKYLR